MDAERLEILLTNAIILLLDDGYDAEDLQIELRLTDEEREIYIDDLFTQED